jgi:hypothetical protein
VDSRRCGLDIEDAGEPVGARIDHAGLKNRDLVEDVVVGLLVFGDDCEADAELLQTTGKQALVHCECWLMVKVELRLDDETLLGLVHSLDDADGRVRVRVIMLPPECRAHVARAPVGD